MSEEDPDMRLTDGSMNPNHLLVADFMEGMRVRFRELSAAHEARMNGSQDPVVIALGATATPKALADLHDAEPKPADQL